MDSEWLWISSVTHLEKAERNRIPLTIQKKEEIFGKVFNEKYRGEHEQHS